MALGSGTFVKRDKKFPGIYIRLPRRVTTAEISNYKQAFLGFAILGSMLLG